MNKEEIKQIINTLIMITGDCPYDRDIGKEENIKCGNHSNCVDCWKNELFNELNRLNNKTKLKRLLMKNVKTDEKGRVLLNKDDEWRKETTWDYED